MYNNINITRKLKQDRKSKSDIYFNSNKNKSELEYLKFEMENISKKSEIFESHNQ